MTHKNITDHIQKDKAELSDPTISSQRRRHIEDELGSLESYAANHPDDEHDPSPLELYCDANPNALECRVYND